MIFYSATFLVVVMFVMYAWYRAFGPDRRGCVRCGGMVRHKRGCDENGRA